MRDPARQAERLMAIRLRHIINTHLEDQGITAPTASAPGLVRPRPRRLAC